MEKPYAVAMAAMDPPADTHCDRRSAMPLQVPGLPNTSFIPDRRWASARGEKGTGAGERAAAAGGRSGEAGHPNPHRGSVLVL